MWFDDMLHQLELDEKERKFNADRITCDKALAAIAVLQERIQEAEEIADSEVKIVEEFRNREVSKLNRQIAWLSNQLEMWIRSTDQSTINLPRGVLRLRMGRPKVEVVDLELFLREGKNLGLVRMKQTAEPDLNAVRDYVQRVGTPPPGAALIQAAKRFTFQTTKGSNNGREQRTSEAGRNGESDEVEIAA